MQSFKLVFAQKLYNVQSTDILLDPNKELGEVELQRE